MNTLVNTETIAGTGKYEDIIENLREAGVLSLGAAEIREAYSSRLLLGGFSMSDRDFETLAVLGLYDKSTLEHSIRTFELAYRFITRPFTGPSGETIIFGDSIGDAGISKEQFLRAALFHDIGKIIIPREILHNALDDEEVLIKMLPEELSEQTEYEKKALLQTLYAKGIRPIDVVPLKEIFTGEKYAELLNNLTKRGFHETATLKDVIRMHEPEGKRILLSLGYKTEGELAGCHHNYEKETHPHRVNISGQSIGIADFIRIVDITDALCSARWYKKPLSEIDVLFILTEDADMGKVDPFLTYVWVKDRYAKLAREHDSALLPVKEKQKDDEIRAIETFLKKKEQSA